VAHQFEKNARLQCELIMMGKFKPFTKEDLRHAPKKTLGTLGADRAAWKTWDYFVSLAKRRGVLN
jgi:hypothetical protein